MDSRTDIILHSVYLSIISEVCCGTHSLQTRYFTYVPDSLPLKRCLMHSHGDSLVNMLYVTLHPPTLRLLTHFSIHRHQMLQRLYVSVHNIAIG